MVSSSAASKEEKDACCGCWGRQGQKALHFLLVRKEDHWDIWMHVVSNPHPAPLTGSCYWPSCLFCLLSVSTAAATQYRMGTLLEVHMIYLLISCCKKSAFGRMQICYSHATRWMLLAKCEIFLIWLASENLWGEDTQTSDASASSCYATGGIKYRNTFTCITFLHPI